MPRYSKRNSKPEGEEPPPVKLSASLFREAADLLKYLWPYRLKFAAALVTLFLASLLSLVLPYLTGRLIDVVLADRFATAAPSFWPVSINQIALALLLALLLQAVVIFLEMLWLNEVGERSLADLRADAYSRLIRLPMTFFSQRRVGELTSRIAADLAQIQDTLITTAPHGLRQVALFAGGLVLLGLTSGRLTLVLLLSLPVLIGLAGAFGAYIRRVSNEAQDRLADSNVILEETLQGIASVKAFTNEGHDLGRYRAGLRAFLESAIRGAKYRGAFVAFIISAMFASVVLVLWYGATLVQSGDLSAGELTRFLLYTMFVAGAMGSFAELYGQLQRALGASQRVRELLRETPEAVEEAATPQVGPRLRGEVEFQKVTFSYPSRPDVQVLKGLSLVAGAGERVALVGPSGAGKSTAVSLLLRFYDPDHGRILVDGKDLRDYPLSAYRRQLAVVPQEVLLFGGTIAENIAYGKPGAGEAEVIEAARRANAHDFIVGFPDGYQTRVGERGVQLSGGQRQRVAIARAILKDPAVLLLDEATSALDSESEGLVQQALDELMRGRTSLIIAHRLATVRGADRIYVLKDGAAVETGTHDELIERPDGLYRAYSELQFDVR